MARVKKNKNYNPTGRVPFRAAKCPVNLAPATPCNLVTTNGAIPAATYDAMNRALYPHVIVYSPKNDMRVDLGKGTFDCSGGFFSKLKTELVLPGTNLFSPELGLHGDYSDKKIIPIVYVSESMDPRDGFYPCYLFARVAAGTKATTINEFVRYLNEALEIHADSGNEDWLAEHWVHQTWNRIFPPGGDTYLKNFDGTFPQQPTMPYLVKQLIPHGYLQYEEEDTDGENLKVRMKVPCPPMI